MPALARLFFEGRTHGLTLSAIQRLILVGVGLQHSTMDALAKVLGVATSQLMALFLQAMRKFDKFIRELRKDELAATDAPAVGATPSMQPIPQTLHDDQVSAARDANKQLSAHALAEYAIDADDSTFEAAVARSGGAPSSISLPSSKKKRKARSSEGGTRPSSAVRDKKKQRGQHK